MARVSVIGLGYVGVVSAACLAEEGHQVIGVDVCKTKVDLVNAGSSPIIEEKIGEMISAQVADGKLSATLDIAQAIAESDLSLVCVGTPSKKNGSLDLGYVQRVCEQIGEQLANISQFHTVVIRSTMLPGTMRDLVIPVLRQYSGKKPGIDFGVCNNPEFLREGTAVDDFYNPPKTVIGETDAKSGDLLASLYDKLDAPLLRVDIATAEMVKYTDNVWHAVKVGFANEIGNICKSLNIDSHKVMDIFCQDTKLNLSPYYMKPGFAFGGSCLPKDVRALTYKGRELDLELPILNALMPSNKIQVERAVAMIEQSGKRSIGLLGLSFKAGTDDLRESPLVTLVEALIGKGYQVKIYDKNVHLASLTGANKDYIHHHIPHIHALLTNDAEMLASVSDLLVVGNRSEEFIRIIAAHPDTEVLDLVRIVDDFPDNYQGICW